MTTLACDMPGVLTLHLGTTCCTEIKLYRPSHPFCVEVEVARSLGYQISIYLDLLFLYANIYYNILKYHG